MALYRRVRRAHWQADQRATVRRAGKLAGVDKKLSRSLDSEVRPHVPWVAHGVSMVGSLVGGSSDCGSRQTMQVVGSLSTTPPSVLSASPVGPLTDANSRKTLIYLILTLNHMYPDYDFSMLRAQHFRKEEDLRFARANIDNLMLETAKVSRSDQPPAAVVRAMMRCSFNPVRVARGDPSCRAARAGC